MTNQPAANSTETNNEGAGTQQAPNTDVTKVADANGQAQNEGAANTDVTKVGEADKGKADDKANGEGDKNEGDDKNKADDKKPDQKAPEKYEDFKLPEGTEVDTELMGEFTTLAKDLNLTQEQAQKLAELGGKIALKANGPGDEAIIEQAKGVWGKEVLADKEIGGDKLAENLSVAKKTLDTFGTPALTELLNKSGMGNHPEVIRLFLKVGKQISDDNVLVSGNRSPSPQNHADKLYGSSSNKT